MQYSVGSSDDTKMQENALPFFFVLGTDTRNVQPWLAGRQPAMPRSVRSF